LGKGSRKVNNYFMTKGSFMCRRWLKVGQKKKKAIIWWFEEQEKKKKLLGASNKEEGSGYLL